MAPRRAARKGVGIMDKPKLLMMYQEVSAEVCSWELDRACSDEERKAALDRHTARVERFSMVLFDE